MHVYIPINILKVLAFTLKTGAISVPNQEAYDGHEPLTIIIIIIIIIIKRTNDLRHEKICIKNLDWAHFRLVWCAFRKKKKLGKVIP